MNLQGIVRLATSGFANRAVSKRLGTVSGFHHVPVSGPFVLVPNHKSYFDHFVVQSLLAQLRGTPVWFLTKRESFEKPLPRLWAEAWRGIPVDRDAPRPDTMRAVRDALASGDAVCIYPEGTRNPDDELLPFRHGAFRFAMAYRVPIIPLGITGTDRVLPRGAVWFRRARIDVAFGPPLDTDTSLSHKEAAENLAEQAAVAVSRLAQDACAAANGSPTAEQRVEQSIALDRAMSGGLDQIGRLDSRTIRRLGRLAAILRADDGHDVNLYAQHVRLRGFGLMNRPPALRPIVAMALRRDIRRILDLDPHHRVGNYLMGRWNLGMPSALGGSPNLAVTYFLRAADASDAGDTRALLGAAEAHRAAGDTDSAVDLLSRVVSETPENDPRYKLRTARARSILSAIQAGSVNALSS